MTDSGPASQVFAFDVRHVGLPIARWRYDIVCDDDGCRVTERTWDRRPGWFSRTAWIGTGVRDRDAANAEHIKPDVAAAQGEGRSGLVRTARDLVGDDRDR